MKKKKRAKPDQLSYWQRFKQQQMEFAAKAARGELRFAGVREGGDSFHDKMDRDGMKQLEKFGRQK